MPSTEHNKSRTINLQDASEAAKLINQASTILIISHRSPDPDSIGSNLSLRLALTRLGKNIVSACVDPAPATCRFHPLSETLTSEINPNDFDLIISVDCGSTDQVALGKIYPEIFTVKPFINIDHHVSNNLFGKINLVYINFSSTSEIIYQLFKIWQFTFTPDISTLLLMGLYYDTGSFKHSNVTPEVLEMAEHLMQNGANLNLITSNLFKRFSVEKFHLWGEILEKFQLTEQKAATAGVSQKTLQNHQTTSEELSGLIEYLSSASGSDFAVLAHEDTKGNIKGSLRTGHNHIDLSQLAAQLGGGGHKKASGFSFPGKISTQTVWTINSTP